MVCVCPVVHMRASVCVCVCVFAFSVSWLLHHFVPMALLIIKAAVLFVFCLFLLSESSSPGSTGCHNTDTPSLGDITKD